MAQAQAQHQPLQHGKPKTIDRGGPSATKVLAVISLFPVGGGLLFFSGVSFVATLVGLAVVAPLFVIFSPILVPALLVVGLAVAGFLTSGALGITALSSLSWIANYLLRRGGAGALSPQHAIGGAREAAGQLGQKAKEVGHGVQSKAQEATKT